MIGYINFCGLGFFTLRWKLNLGDTGTATVVRTMHYFVNFCPKILHTAENYSELKILFVNFSIFGGTVVIITQQSDKTRMRQKGQSPCMYCCICTCREVFFHISWELCSLIPACQNNTQLKALGLYYMCTMLNKVNIISLLWYLTLGNQIQCVATVWSYVIFIIKCSKLRQIHVSFCSGSISWYLK